jgi:hypothetical protein
VVLRILRDTAPQQRQHLAVAVLAIDAGPPQLQNLRPQMLVGSEVELLRAVVAQPATCGHAVLHAVRAYNSPCRLLLDQQVLTDRVVLILVNTARVRRCQTLAPFQVEDAKAQPAGGQPVQLGLCQTQPVEAEVTPDPVRLAPHLRRTFSDGSVEDDSTRDRLLVQAR